MSHLIDQVDEVRLQRLLKGQKVHANCSLGSFHGSTMPQACQRFLSRMLGSTECSEYADPQGLPSTRTALINYHQRKFDLDLGGADACITFGARNALIMGVCGLVGPGQLVASMDPGYGGQRVAIKRSGATHLPIPCSLEQSFVEGLVKEVRKGNVPTLIIYDSVHNPSGRVMTLKELEELGDLAYDIGAMLIEDAVYRELVFDGPPAPTMQQIGRIRNRLVTITSGSKVYRLAGLRIGGMFGAPYLISRIMEARREDNYGPPVTSQWPYEAALNECDGEIVALNADLKLRAKVMHKGFADAGWNTEKPEAGIFFWTDTPNKESAERFCTAAGYEAGWFFYPGKAFTSPQYKDTSINHKLRIGLMETVARIQDGLPYLHAFLRNGIAARAEFHAHTTP